MEDQWLTASCIVLAVIGGLGIALYLFLYL